LNIYFSEDQCPFKYEKSQRCKDTNEPSKTSEEIILDASDESSVNSVKSVILIENSLSSDEEIQIEIKDFEEKKNLPIITDQVDIKLKDKNSPENLRQQSIGNIKSIVIEHNTNL
jgi:hypothetical protein